MTSDFNSEILGDCFVHSIHVDFTTKQTIITLSGHPENNTKDIHELTFTNVIWQDLNHIQDYNIFWGMEVSDSFSDFQNREKDYLLKMKGYFRPGLLESIQMDKTLKYYFIIPTAGLSGFIICKEANITTTQNVA